MKFTISIALALAVLLPAQSALADFYIYKTDALDVFEQEWDNWQIFPGSPSCDDVNNNARLWGNYADVSGDKRGIRCEGDGCDREADPSGVDVLEMNFSGEPLYHWTIYKDRDYVMTGLDGSTFRGSCYPDDGDDFECINVLLGLTAGKRKFRCETDITADDIN